MSVRIRDVYPWVMSPCMEVDASCSVVSFPACLELSIIAGPLLNHNDLYATKWKFIVPVFPSLRFSELKHMWIPCCWGITALHAPLRPTSSFTCGRAVPVGAQPHLTNRTGFRHYTVSSALFSTFGANFTFQTYSADLEPSVKEFCAITAEHSFEFHNLRSVQKPQRWLPCEVAADACAKFLLLSHSDPANRVRFE